MSDRVEPLAASFKDEKVGRALTAAEIAMIGGGDGLFICANDSVTDRDDGTSTYDIDGFRVDD